MCNLVGDNGVLALVDALKLNQHFSRLNLSHNGIRNKGAIALCMPTECYELLTEDSQYAKDSPAVDIT